MTAAVEDLPCIELVEWITDYLEGALVPAERARFEEHLAICSGCRHVMDQWAVTIAVTGRLAAPDIDAVEALAPDVMAALVAAFRHARPT